MTLSSEHGESTWPPIKPGTEVVTTQPNTALTGWTEAAISSRRWGILGLVINHHDSHGLSYEVKHVDDKSIGHYDPTELEIRS